jgi:hypothetical protein
VKAGGAALFTGGQWAFGKGGYLLTVLERDLLPVDCVELNDCRTLEKPAVMEPGKDFAELGIKADFAAKPSFWVYNQVLLKNDPRVKVFLTSARGPVLVGWQLGKGRVACLLVDHRGKSEGGTTAFFDWKDWPGLATAVMRWLAPEAGLQGKPRPAGIDAAEAKRLLAGLGQGAEEDALGGGKPAKKPVAKPAKGSDAFAVVEQLLSAPAGSVDAAVLLAHVATIGMNDVQTYRVAAWLLANPPADLPARAAAMAEGKDAGMRFLGLQLTTDAAAWRTARNAGAPPAETQRRLYALTQALPLVAGKDLLEDGRAVLATWNAEEQRVRDAWTGGKGFSVAAPELPCLDAEALYARIGWLAYLARQAPDEFGPQFIREWLMIAVYQDYCGRSAGTKRPGDWSGLRAALGRLRDVAAPGVERLRDANPKAFAEGCARLRYTREYLAARNLLGDITPAAGRTILERLRSASQADLAAFAAARSR